jgi:hypothetical protein
MICGVVVASAALGGSGARGRTRTE